MGQIVAFVPRQEKLPPAAEAAADAQFAADIAGIDFEPIEEFINFPSIGERAEAHEARLRTFGIATRWSIAVLGQSKSKLVEIVREFDESDPTIANNLLRDLMAASAFLRTMDDMIRMASDRLGVAIAANVPAHDTTEA